MSFEIVVISGLKDCSDYSTIQRNNVKCKKYKIVSLLSIASNVCEGSLVYRVHRVTNQ